MFDNLKIARDMMKDMSPEQIQELMESAKGQQKILEDSIIKIVDQEIEKKDLMSKDEVEKLINSKCQN